MLIAISADPIEELATWARDDEFPFLMASDADFDAARQYGAIHSSGRVTNRSLFVVGPDGRIAYRAIPFREVDPTAYEELAEVIDRLATSND